MKSKALSNNSYQNWQTPQWLFNRLNEIYNFNVDGAASHDNALLPNYYTETGFFGVKPLVENFFINPPWDELSQDIWWETASTTRTVMLVPFTPETKMWHKYVWKPSVQVFVFNKRINYVSPITKQEQKGIARPSCLVIFNRGIVPTKLLDLGCVVQATYIKE